MELESEEMYIVKENLCCRQNTRTPYAQLGAVETEQSCCCCHELPETAQPQCGCAKELVDMIANDLQERKVKRGNIAQLKMQENLMNELLKLDAKLTLLMHFKDAKYPPSDEIMKKIFGKTIELPADYTTGPPMPPIVGGQQMQVRIPEGSGPGQTIQVQGPSGQQVQVTVPPGAKPGSTITIQVPTVAQAPTPQVIGNPM
jgi:hypothetical protein